MTTESPVPPPDDQAMLDALFADAPDARDPAAWRDKPPPPVPEWALNAAHEYFSDQWTHLGIHKGAAVNVLPLARLLASVRNAALREAAGRHARRPRPRRGDCEGGGVSGPFLVVPGDHGIRPAGPSDRCFYCDAAVGSPHGQRCVCVVRNVAFEVRVDGRQIGTWIDAKPAHWSAEDCHRHANDSSWCKDNMVDTGDYAGEELPDPGEGCLCDVVTLRVASMESEPWLAR